MKYTSMCYMSSEGVTVQCWKPSKTASEMKNQVQRVVNYMPTEIQIQYPSTGHNVYLAKMEAYYGLNDLFIKAFHKGLLYTQKNKKN